MKYFASALVLFAGAAIALQSIETTIPSQKSVAKLMEEKLRAVRRYEEETEIDQPSKSRSQCDNVKFCRDFMASKQMPNATSPYALSNFVVNANNTITADLTNALPNNVQAASLTLELKFYQEGIMQVNLACPGEDARFGISSTGIGVAWEQLVQETNLASKTTTASDRATVSLQSSDGLNQIRYEVLYSPFRIIQYINNIVTLVVNDAEDLRYASLDAPHNTYMNGNDQLIEGYEIGVGITLSTDYVFGLPQRAASTFQLKHGVNYRLFNQDKFDHPYGTLDPLYGSWPYLTGHSAVMDASVVWMNSSETYVNIDSTTNSVT